MNRSLFTLLVAVGLGVIAWVGVGFVGHSLLALLMTALIAAVFSQGAQELHRFRQSTAQLAAALNQPPSHPDTLDTWLGTLPTPLRTPVRLRLEGERVALPGPTLTPYLVGLLVMLGMLGTFLGMVITFKGAVFALDGSTDLQTIRAALAAPLKGLGLSFGTSVAGVASSAVLGLLSSLSRRERLAVLRQLDTLAATELHRFTLAHQRQQAYQAVQAQAAGLPALVERLGALLDGLEQRSQQLNQQLLEQQAQFHQQTTSAYTTLASQVEAALQNSLAASALAAVDNLQPVLANALHSLTQNSQQLQQQQIDTTQAQLTRLLTEVRDTTQQQQIWHSQQEAQRLNHLTNALGQLADTLRAEWQRAGSDTLAQQQAICQTLEATAQRLSEQQAQQQQAAFSEWAKVLHNAETLVQTRLANEADWLQQQQTRMDQLATLWCQEMGALRTEEAQRGQAAVDRLGELHSAVALQLGSLGQALEAPISRMLQTAAEVPQAAAEVMHQLRQQATLMTERDTQTLQERTQVMGELGTLLHTLEQASSSFRQTLQVQAQQATEQSVHLHGSAIELSSLGAAFDHGVQRFTSSNEQLLAGLQRIEAALQQSQTRSDEQLAYYVAQAREVVDLSISAQQGILDDLRRLQTEQRALAAGAA